MQQPFHWAGDVILSGNKRAPSDIMHLSMLKMAVTGVVYNR
jgi:hypothetical protein